MKGQNKMEQSKVIKFKPKPKPLKYFLCEFFKRSGEDENTYHYIYSDKNLKQMKYKGNDKDDHIILSQFFLQKITPKDEDDFSTSHYWTNDGLSLVRFDGMEEVEPYEFKTLQRAKVYVNGENLMFDYEKGHQQ
jgi:hypothetical protein